MRVMVHLFRAIYLVGSALSLSAGALVTASLFIADRAPQSGTFFTISLIVTGVFLTVGVLLFGIQRHGAAIAVRSGQADVRAPAELGRHVTRLLVHLCLAGLLLDAIMAVMVYVILARIDQGFAVFG